MITASHTTVDRRRVILGPDGRIATPDLTPSAAVGSFQATDTSRDRGYVWIPTLDSKKEVDEWSHRELLTRSRVLYNSGGGFYNGALHAISRMVCGTGLMPYPTPPKVRGREMKIREWSRHVRRRYARKCGTAATFDIAGRFNTGQAQRATVLNKLKDGDMFWILTRDEESGRLRVAMREASECGNGRAANSTTDKTWTAGVKCGPQNQALAYRFLGTDSSGKQTQTDIDAENVRHCVEQDRLHAVRGLARAYPVLNQMFDRGEINAAITKGIKVREHVAYAIEQDMPTAGKIAGAPGTTLGGGIDATKFIEGNDGKLISLEKFLTGGEARYLKPGQTFKMIESTRPDSNVRAHLNGLDRSIARALRFSVEILWDIIELGGANMRFVQAETQAEVEIEQEDLVDHALGPHYLAWLRDEIEAGEIEEIDGWEEHAWLPPARLTVDFGRDGQLYIKELDKGLRTMKSLYGFRGEEWQIEIDQYLDERQYIVEGVESREITTPDGKTRPMTMKEAFPAGDQSPLNELADTMRNPPPQPEPPPPVKK